MEALRPTSSACVPETRCAVTAQSHAFPTPSFERAPRRPRFRRQRGKLTAAGLRRRLGPSSDRHFGVDARSGKGATALVFSAPSPVARRAAHISSQCWPCPLRPRNIPSLGRAHAHQNDGEEPKDPNEGN
jgi:hypothetical protein